MYQLENVVRSLNLKKSRAGFTGGCPACGYPTGFSLSEKNGTLLAYCHVSQCSWASIKPFLNNYSPPISNCAYRAKAAKPAKAKHTKASDCYSAKGYCYSDEYHSELWNKSLNGNSSIIRNYLRSRGITLPVPTTVRYLPQARHTQTGQYFPVMLAKVQLANSNEVVAVHRTFLKPDGIGKAGVVANKQSLGKLGGASVHLSEPNDVLAVTEGLETAFSVQQVTGIPTWSALNCEGLKSLIVPKTVKTIFIFADNDSHSYSSNPGLKAAHSAADRFCRLGFTVKVTAPQTPRQDFNDLLREGTFSV